MQDIVILGAGGFAREVAWLIKDINRASPQWNILGFSDTDPAKIGMVVGDWSALNPSCSISGGVSTGTSASMGAGVGEFQYPSAGNGPAGARDEHPTPPRRAA